MFVTDLETFFAEQTGGIVVGQVEALPGRVAVGTDGYVCLRAGEDGEDGEDGETGFFIPIDNPLGYALRVESSFIQDIGGGMEGITVTQAGTDRLAVHIPQGNTAGNEGVLHIKVTTAKEGRVLYEGVVGIAYLESLDVTSWLNIEILPDGQNELNVPFDVNIPRYSIANALPSFFIKVTAVAPENLDNPGPLSPLITIDGMSGRGVLTCPVSLTKAFNTLAVRVELPHGVGARNYSIEAARADAVGVSLVVAHEPAKTVYQVQAAAVQDGANPDPAITNGLVLNYVTGGVVVPLDLGQCTFSYDLTTPGIKTVTIKYHDSNLNLNLEAKFYVYVVGLASLTVTGPGYNGQTVNHQVPGVYPLDEAPYGVENLFVTAESGFETYLGETLTIKRTVPTVDEGVMEGAAKKIPLAPGANTITVTVTLDKENGNAASETWDLTVFKIALQDGGALYVSDDGNDANAGDTAAAPFVTMGKALALIKASGLGASAEFTIVVSGTIVADTVSSYGMMEIDAGYPHIILEGAAGGGTIDAGGSQRVLRISGGATVTLGDNLTLTGGNASSGDGGGVYVIGTGSSFIMAGGIIQGNEGSSGGGVYVYEGGFTMSGGFIQGNEGPWGAGVYVAGGGAFEMSGGSIEGNEGTFSGGVHVAGAASVFTMSGGAVIQGNTASGNGLNTGGGVYVNNGTFIKTGGTIAGSGAAWPNTRGNPANANAVCCFYGKTRTLTADTGIKLYARDTSGSWSYVDPASGGLGDTTEHWDLPSPP
jgi:hypothetical protein